MAGPFRADAGIQVTPQASWQGGSSVPGMYHRSGTGGGWFVRDASGTEAGPIVGGRILDAKTFGAVGDGTTDDTTAVQAAINAATSDTRVIQFPSGKYKITSTLTITQRGLIFLGGRHGRPAETGGTRFEFYGTGECIRLGSDNGHSYDASDYDGVQGFTCRDIAFSYLGASTTSLLNGQGTYGTGTYAIRDWRGGDIMLRNVTFEHFQYGFWGIQSDLNYFDLVEANYCSCGLYFGPRSDQFTLHRFYGFYNDTALWLDAARGARIRDCNLVDNGSATTYPVKIGSAWSMPSQNITFENLWCEHFVGPTTIPAFFAIGVGDTQTTTNIRFNNTAVLTNVQGTPSYAQYFAEIDHADTVIVDGVGMNMVNLAKAFKFSGSGSATVYYITTLTQGLNKWSPVYANTGTGTPHVIGQYFDGSTNSIRFDANVIAAGAGYLQSGTGGIYANGPIYPAPNSTITPAGSGTMSIGTANATSVTIAAVGVPTTIGGSLATTQAFHPSTPASATQNGALYMGSGVPANVTGNNGDVYFRTDTPGTSLQRIYQKSAGSWVGVV